MFMCLELLLLMHHLENTGASPLEVQKRTWLSAPGCQKSSLLGIAFNTILFPDSLIFLVDNNISEIRSSPSCHGQNLMLTNIGINLNNRHF